MSLSLDRKVVEDPSPWAEFFPIDAVTPITAVHRGIEYRGEVVRAARWSASLGQAPRDGSYFKIVLLQSSPKLGLQPTLDRNTAVCVPASRSGSQTQRIIGEITAAKRASYLTRRDVDAAAINSALRERQDDLENLLVEEESARFAKGSILVQDGPGPELVDVYAGDDPADWMENLAGWLLARRYPRLPVDTCVLDQPVTEDDVAEIFESIFDRSGGNPAFLVALGLASPDTNSAYDPSRCPVFQLVRDKMGGGASDFGELHKYLSDEIGLTGQLASLFLVLFVSYESPEHPESPESSERPEYQISLKNHAEITMVDGGQFFGTRLTPDLIPLIAWDEHLASKAASIAPASEPSFDDVKHHLSVLCPESMSCPQDSVNQVLASHLVFIGGQIAIARQIMDLFDAEFSVELEQALHRLRRVSGVGYARIYHSIRTTYSSLFDLRDDLETVRELASLQNDAEEIFRARTYIAEAQVPAADFPNLAVDRDTLLTGLAPARLVPAKSRGWSAIARDAAAFKLRYIQAYRDHHQRFHDELPGFQSELMTAKKKSAALGLLNTLVELGEPTGTALDEGLAALVTGPSPCSQQGNDLDLSGDSSCRECRISLLQHVPSAELARLAPQVDMALGGKTQELSRCLVEKALAGHAGEKWQEFLQIVQASELSSLANTLDNDLVTFIKQVLD